MITVVRCDADGSLKALEAAVRTNGALSVSSGRGAKKLRLYPLAWKKMCSKEHIGFFSSSRSPPRAGKGSKHARVALPPPFDDLCLRAPFYASMRNEAEATSLSVKQFLRFFDQPRRSKLDPFMLAVIRRCQTIDDESDSSQESDDSEEQHHRSKDPATADFEFTDTDDESSSSLGEYDYGGVTYGVYS